jgi:hypothetical protein
MAIHHDSLKIPSWDASRLALLISSMETGGLITGGSIPSTVLLNH